MKRVALTLALSSLIFSPLSLAEEETNAFLTTYRSTIGELMSELKSELMAAMTKDGPANALEVCSTKAPQISAIISKQAGFFVGRTSLKPRNANNVPDSWEKKVLDTFEKRKAQGENPKTLEFFEVVETDGHKKRRYMKAIGTGGICLLCHGSNILPEVEAKLKELYPDDTATGFKIGDLRGAFSITDNL